LEKALKTELNQEERETLAAFAETLPDQVEMIDKKNSSGE
jgi:hypothetical protein